MPVPHVTAGRTSVLIVLFLVVAITEELGWMGYAIDPMQDRHGALRASIALGIVWAAWHVIPLQQAGRTLVFIGWWSLETVALRVLMVRLYNRAGRSVPTSIILHMMANLTWMLFPIDGSFYDPKVTGGITALVTVVVIARDARRRS
jgi:membrane protease YdiL (CAAX protease family)